MNFTKADIGKRIIIRGCGFDNHCKSCGNPQCASHVKDEYIIGIVEAVEPANPDTDTYRKVFFNIEGTQYHDMTRAKWCEPFKDPEHVVEVFF